MISSVCVYMSDETFSSFPAKSSEQLFVEKINFGINFSFVEKKLLMIHNEGFAFSGQSVRGSFTDEIVLNTKW